MRRRLQRHTPVPEAYPDDRPATYPHVPMALGVTGSSGSSARTSPSSSSTASSLRPRRHSVLQLFEPGREKRAEKRAAAVSAGPENGEDVAVDAGDPTAVTRRQTRTTRDRAQTDEPDKHSPGRRF